MPYSLDLTNWNRKSAYELFRTYEMPFFNVTVKVDVTKAYEYAKSREESFFLLNLYHSLMAANQIENFRMRIQGEQVVVYEHIHCGSTVLHEDQTFSFCYFEHTSDWTEFHEQGLARIKAQQEAKTFDLKLNQDNMIHYSVLPWLHFSSFQHARRLGREDSIPKFVFGKYQAENDRLMMPVSVEVHHALVDGYHVSQFVNLFQKALDNLATQGDNIFV